MTRKWRKSSKHLLDELFQFFESNYMDSENWEAFRQAHNKKIEKTFVPGKRYFIVKRGRKKPDVSAFTASSREFVYQYVTKKGIHHIFRNVPAGWITTYTDAQLTDTSIYEI